MAVAIAAEVALSALLSTPSNASSRAPSCRFVLGFKALHDAMPDTVGDCLDDEQHNPANGDAVQHTTGVDGKGGLLVWRKADNWTAYTDGYRTWVNGPFGLQERLNTQRFAWEANPTGLPVVAAPVSPPARDVVVFVPGYGSSYPAPGYPADFRSVEADLLQRGWTPDRLLAFGYAGGSVQDGAWVPNPYDCAATTLGVEHAAAILRDTLSAYRAAHPTARFILVGHSLGGLVAWWSADDADRGIGPALPIDGIITVDSPLLGAEPAKLSVLDAACQVDDNRTVADLAALDADRATFATRWAALARRLVGRGIAVRTVGNDDDCLYWPNLAGCPDGGLTWSDDRSSQYVPSVALHVSIPIDPNWSDPLDQSHVAVLTVAPFHTRIADLIAGASR